MSIKTAILCAALGVGAIALPGSSEARVYLDVTIAPPAPRYEVVPMPRRGYVWADGYWTWNGHRYVWVRGHYIRARHGHHWIADRWEDRHGRWHYYRGHWD